MKICINEECRATGFNFIDFENSFVYGTADIVASNIPSQADFKIEYCLLIGPYWSAADRLLEKFVQIIFKSLKVRNFSSIDWPRFIKCNCLVLGNEFR